VTCTRRTLLRGFVAGTACSALGCRLPLDAGDQPTDAPSAPDGGTCGVLVCLSLTDTRNAALKNVGGAVVVAAPAAQDTLVIIRTSPSAVVALSDVCTHRGCVMSYIASSSVLHCPCHGSEFSLTGAVLRGPAVSPVRLYTATLDTTANTIDVT
jgi:cytochrome b6-f complex iron-sulfur subunit